MLSCFLDLCRIIFCCEDDEIQEGRSRYGGGGYYAPLRRESSPKRSPAAEACTPYVSTYNWKASSPSAAPTCFLFSSPAASRSSSSVSEPSPPLSKPSKPYSSSPSSSSSSSASFPSPSPAKPQSKPSSPSPAKVQPPRAAPAGAKASRLSEPYSSPSRLSSKASSSSSSSLTPPSIASSASPAPVKARSPHAAASAHGSSASSSSSSSSVAPATASLSSPQFEQRNQLPRYEIPKQLQEQIKNDVVPQVLRKPLSPSAYADYFAALLYAEDYYCEKWSDFLLLDVALELRGRDSFKIQNSAGGNKNNKSNAQKDKPLVAFEIGSVPEKRPFLLSRDHVLLRPAGKKTEPFQGILFRVEKSQWVVAEFADDFHKQHSPSKKYDVSFSFNRACLKRSHQAVSAAMDPFLCSILFPDPPPRNPFLGPIRGSDFTPKDRKSNVLAIIGRILRLKSPQPYLLEGPLSQVPGGDLSDMGKLIRIAILQLYGTCSSSRILVCAPRNRTLDALTKSLLKDIPESRMFRANAAFRDYGLVPDDVMPACLFEGECFTCPPLAELKSFRVVTSTFISSYRLYAAGIGADHFTHIFLVDASYATEPETIVAFANLVGKTTAIVATGSAPESPAWVRSDIGRRNGLKKSFFRRLLEMAPYSLRDPMFIAHI